MGENKLSEKCLSKEQQDYLYSDIYRRALPKLGNGCYFRQVMDKIIGLPQRVTWTQARMTSLLHIGRQKKKLELGRTKLKSTCIYPTSSIMRPLAIQRWSPIGLLF